MRLRRWGSLQRSPRPPTGFIGPTSKGRGGHGRGEEERERKEAGGEREVKAYRYFFFSTLSPGSSGTTYICENHGLGPRPTCMSAT